MAHWSGDCLPFLTRLCYYGHKILNFSHKQPNKKVVHNVIFFYNVDRFFRNLAKNDKKLRFFWIENHKIDFFSNFFTTKSSKFISTLNGDFYEASFEV